MISYYRIYYDQQIAFFSGVNYLYIYKPLSSYELTQEELANFINTNQDSVSFTCEVNRFMYATVRYIPWKSENLLPIEKQSIFDVFIYPTPIKNKLPSYVSSSSIKTSQAFVLRQKVTAMDTITGGVVEKLLTPISNA